MDTVIAFTAIVAVWTSSLGTAWVCRRRGLARSRSIAAVGCCYASVSAVALVWLGLTWNGLFGVIGMSLPFAIATLLVAGKPTPFLHR